MDFEEFFNAINLRNDSLIQIKKNLIQLLIELVENKIIQNEVEVVFKSDKKILFDQKFDCFRYNLTDRIYLIIVTKIFYRLKSG